MRIGRILLIILYFGALVLVGSKVFFESKFDAAVGAMMSHQGEELKTLRIGLSEPAVSLHPLTNDIGSRTRLLHIYEPLIRVVPDLRLEPALAISYGVQDSTTWEFRIRPDVRFHDGSLVTFADIEYSLLQARDAQNSGVSDLAANIAAIEKIDEETFHITTQAPDPLLPAKLSSLFIFKGSSEQHIGTGPYIFAQQKEGILHLNRHDAYWDKAPAFATVELVTLASKSDRTAALQEKTVSVLQNLPPDLADAFPVNNFVLKTMPSLEVNFLLFNFQSIFKDPLLREAVIRSIDREKLAKLGFGFATPVYQFIPNGVFGYDGGLEKLSYNEARARELVSLIKPPKITLDLPQGLEGLGKNLMRMFERVGLAAEIRIHSIAEIGQLIQKRQSPFFFFGWRSDLGDALDFLTAVVHSPQATFGQFNGANYINPEVDKLIEESRETLDPRDRLRRMRRALAIITVQDMVGVPLFSPEVPYAVSGDILWEPRVDGYVLAQEVGLRASSKK